MTSTYKRWHDCIACWFTAPLFIRTLQSSPLLADWEIQTVITPASTHGKGFKFIDTLLRTLAGRNGPLPPSLPESFPFLFLFSQAFITQQCAYNPIDSGSTDPFFVIFSFSSMQFLRLFQKEKERKIVIHAHHNVDLMAFDLILYIPTLRRIHAFSFKKYYIVTYCVENFG